MVRWLLSAALLVALPVADLLAADSVFARLCRSKEILKIYDTAFDSLVLLNTIPE